MTIDDRTEKIRDLFEALAEEFVTGPSRTAVRTEASSTVWGHLETPFSFCGLDIHPVFTLAHHFRANDSGNAGYTDNPHRGDHMSVPVVFDDTWGILETSFHKGRTFAEFITPAPEPENPLYRAALALLKAEETR